MAIIVKKKKVLLSADLRILRIHIILKLEYLEDQDFLRDKSFDPSGFVEHAYVLNLNCTVVLLKSLSFFFRESSSERTKFARFARRKSSVRFWEYCRIRVFVACSKSVVTYWLLRSTCGRVPYRGSRRIKNVTHVGFGVN